ncbi:amidase [Purpureocillium lavendulum]|uniref:Amidase n=1 Tax=Purpureocillium lavendulum TaxID=1247861 RepID=A0AB34FJI1_9HYPO|nr:amidase [Purpureocillium lavendulum]
MSTFDGRVSEFPDIRIDFFRNHPDTPPPLACFLSHVHSDHLAGLESLRSPLYPCRINYAQGILETRHQTYKHLSKVLKPLPLETSTVIELQPGHCIRVTLFDANHCPGAVMFLVEGSGKAILYTGDVRCEPWFVNALVRHPLIVEYCCGIKTLDKIYLDTSFTSNVPFQTKAEGLAELLRKIARYPADTIFHFQAWTYGYEDVWLALSRALDSPIHVDDYKMRVYGSLRSRLPDKQSLPDVHLSPCAASLAGHMCGNAFLPGCLTSEREVRLHSCEKGNICSVAQGPAVVSIRPIVAHLADGSDLVEAGIGGGGGDLEREAEIVFSSQDDLGTLAELMSTWSGIATVTPSDLRGVDTQDYTETGPQSDSPVAAGATYVEATSTPNRQTAPPGYASTERMVSLLPDSQRFDEPTPSTAEVDYLAARPDQHSHAHCAVQIEEIAAELPVKRKRKQEQAGLECDDEYEAPDSQRTQASWTSAISASHSLARREAYETMLQNVDGNDWKSIALLSTDGHHTANDKEL